MLKKLTRTGNSLALVLDERCSTGGHRRGHAARGVHRRAVIVISPVRGRRRTAKLKAIVAEAHARYGGVFRRLAEE